MAATGTVTLLGAVAGGIAVFRLPTDYLKRASSPSRRKHRWNAKKVLINIAGIALLAVGVLLSLPGIPGPGIVMLVLGLALTDIPGKHRLIHAIVRRPRVLRSINWLRRRFHRSDFIAPGGVASARRGVRWGVGKRLRRG